MKPSISPKLKSTTKKPISLNNSFSYMKRPPVATQPKRTDASPLKPGSIETPRFKVTFGFNDAPQLVVSQSVDVPKEYFSFGESSLHSLQTEPTPELKDLSPKKNSPINSKVNSAMFKKHTKGTRSTTETSNFEVPKSAALTETNLTNKYKNGYFNQPQKSNSFHNNQQEPRIQPKQGTPTKLRLPLNPNKKLSVKTDAVTAPSKHIQIFNNNYNIININDTTKEKRDSLKSLQKQFQQILQTQQLLETKQTVKKSASSEKSTIAKPAPKKLNNTSSDNIFQAIKN